MTEKYPPLSQGQRAMRYQDVLERAERGPKWADMNSATPAAVKTFKDHATNLARAMEEHMRWEAEFLASLQ